MTNDIVYSLTYKSGDKNYYQITNSSSLQITHFYNKLLKECRLLSQYGEELTSLAFNPPSKSISINFKNFSPLSDIKFLISLTNYKLTASYQKGEIQLNWKWLQQNNSHIYELVDVDRDNLVLARIEGLSLSKKSVGAIVISPEVNSDFWDVILFTACLVFKHNEEVAEEKVEKYSTNTSFMDDPKYKDNYYKMWALGF